MYCFVWKVKRFVVTHSLIFQRRRAGHFATDALTPHLFQEAKVKFWFDERNSPLRGVSHATSR